MTICSAHKGQVGYRVRALGKAVHSSRPEDGVNAIEGIAHLIEALKDHQRRLMSRDPHPMCGHGRCCPSVIRGGTIVSTVPDACELEVDRRTLPGESVEAVYRELEHLLAGITKAHPEFRFEIEGPTIDVQALDVPIENPIVDSMLTAYRSVTGKPIETSAFFAGSDAPHFGFPTLIFGAGSLQQAHSIDEYVEIDDMMIATKVYLSAAIKILCA